MLVMCLSPRTEVAQESPAQCRTSFPEKADFLARELLAKITIPSEKVGALSPCEQSVFPSAISQLIAEVGRC